ERPWVDFAHNRNQAIDLAAGRADYLFFIDADEVHVLPDGFRVPELTADAYDLEMRTSRCSYIRRQLVRAALPWRYRGVMHEYVFCEEAKTSATIAGVHTVPHRDGARARDPHTIRRDALILEQALIDEPDNVRH